MKKFAFLISQWVYFNKDAKSLLKTFKGEYKPVGNGKLEKSGDYGVLDGKIVLIHIKLAKETDYEAIN